MKTDPNFSYLDFHNECMRTGLIPKNGLCICLPLFGLLSLISPDTNELLQLNAHLMSTSYWGSGLSIADPNNKKKFAYTPLRQTIVLFCAAMNNEL